MNFSIWNAIKWLIQAFSGCLLKNLRQYFRKEFARLLVSDTTQHKQNIFSIGDAIFREIILFYTSPLFFYFNKIKRIFTFFKMALLLATSLLTLSFLASSLLAISFLASSSLALSSLIPLSINA